MKPNKTIEVANTELDDAEFGVPNILEVLDGVEFPAAIINLVDYAQDKGASEEVVELIRAMPERDYDSIREVAKFLNTIEDLPGSQNTWSSSESRDMPPPDATPKPGSRNKL